MGVHLGVSFKRGGGGPTYIFEKKKKEEGADPRRSLLGGGGARERRKPNRGVEGGREVGTNNHFFPPLPRGEEITQPHQLAVVALAAQKKKREGERC